MAARFFGQYLLEKGVITAESVLKAVRLQESTNLKLGAYAVKSGALTQKQAEELNSAQRQTDRMFGELAVQRGYLTKAKMDELLAQQRKEHLYIGEALVKVGGMAKDVLEKELANFNAEQKAQAVGFAVPVANIPQSKHIAQLVDLTVKMLRRCADVIAQPSGLALDKKVLDAVFLEAVIPFKGAFKGRYGLRMSKNIAQFISKGMVGEVVDSDEGLADAVREFGNVVAGNLCASLASDGLTAEILPPEHAAPAPRREIVKGTTLALYTLDTVYGPVVAFFEA